MLVLNQPDDQPSGGGSEYGGGWSNQNGGEGQRSQSSLIRSASLQRVAVTDTQRGGGSDYQGSGGSGAQNGDGSSGQSGDGSGGQSGDGSGGQSGDGSGGQSGDGSGGQSGDGSGGQSGDGSGGQSGNGYGGQSGNGSSAQAAAGVSLLLDDESVINGSAGLDAANAVMHLHSGTITGQVFLPANTAVNNILNDSTVVLGTIVDPTDLTLAGTQASAVSTQFGALPATPGMPSSLTAPSWESAGITLVAGPGLSILKLRQLNLENTTLTVNAPAGAQVVINIAGGVSFQNTALLVAGGIQPGRVVINAYGPGQSVSIANREGSATLFGALILAPQRTVSIEGTDMQGVLVAGQAGITEDSSVSQGSSCPSSVLPI